MKEVGGGGNAERRAALILLLPPPPLPRRSACAPAASARRPPPWFARGLRCKCHSTRPLTRVPASMRALWRGWIRTKEGEEVELNASSGVGRAQWAVTVGVWVRRKRQGGRTGWEGTWSSGVAENKIVGVGGRSSVGGKGETRRGPRWLFAQAAGQLATARSATQRPSPPCSISLPTPCDLPVAAERTRSLRSRVIVDRDTRHQLLSNDRSWRRRPLGTPLPLGRIA